MLIRPQIYCTVLFTDMRSHIDGLKQKVSYCIIAIKEEEFHHHKYRSSFDVRLLLLCRPGLDDSRVPQPQLAWPQCSPLQSPHLSVVSFLTRDSPPMLMSS